ncbi:MAG: asparagine synthase-related protein, partial [Gammaproteobacteria bacterium]
GVFNPNSAVLVQNSSVCLGSLADPGAEWGRTQAPRPDGSYALFRSDDRRVELISDACASRTLWYVQTDDLFVASTSQRAIVTVLGNYQPNPDAHAWMLSAGNIGPGLSWDRRIRCVAGNASVVLDREAWTLQESGSHVEFAPRRAPDRVHREAFIQALRETFGRLRIDYTTWHLMLSGGFDSRCILLMLENKAGLHSITWGLASARDEPKSDAVVAQTLADHFGIAHEYYATDITEQGIDSVFERLLTAGEGRTDTISAYMDGCHIWSRLFSAGIGGVIRGDVVFSPYRVYSEDDVRRINGAMFLKDFANLARLGGSSAETQYWPERLHRRAGESLSTWRDRLTYEYRCPVIWAALNEIKSSYVEVMSPLLSRRVLDVIVALPDHLRDGRSMYREIVAGLSPPIAFAEHNAIESTADILTSPAVARYLRASLDTAEARDLLSGDLIDLVLQKIAASPARRAPRR